MQLLPCLPRSARPLGALLLTAYLLAPGAASAGPAEAITAERTDPFAQATGVGTYVATWAGDYSAIGLGGRARLEYEDAIGLDLFAEVYDVDIPLTTRRDLVIGFNLFTPFAVLDRLRLRPLFGFCAGFSFIEPVHAGAERADDIAFGVHAGGGLEWGVSRYVSVFADGQQILWWGNPRADDGWGGGLDGTLEATSVFQASAGLQLHLL